MRHAAQQNDPSASALETALRYALAIGLALVLVLPAARGSSDTLGWLPLWLLAMPATALWAVRGFPLPARAQDVAIAKAPPRRRGGPQARRRARGAARRDLARAA